MKNKWLKGKLARTCYPQRIVYIEKGAIYERDNVCTLEIDECSRLGFRLGCIKREFILGLEETNDDIIIEFSRYMKPIVTDDYYDVAIAVDSILIRVAESLYVGVYCHEDFVYLQSGSNFASMIGRYEPIGKAKARAIQEALSILSNGMSRDFLLRKRKEFKNDLEIIDTFEDSSRTEQKILAYQLVHDALKRMNQIYFTR